MKKQIAILGSTGSIGTQALQVIEEHPDQYEAYVLTANNRVDDLIAQARKFKPEAVVIANETKYQQLKDALADSYPTGGFRTFRRIPVFSRRGRQSHRESYTDSLRRSVPHLYNGTACHRNQSTGFETPQLGYGSQNHNRLCFHDEQRL